MVHSSNISADLVLEFVKAFEIQDFAKICSIFDDHIVMYITNAQAGVDKVEGREQLINRFQEVDYAQSHLKLTVTQIVTIDPDKVMVMVRVTAHKNNQDLENFSTFLCYVKNNKITHIWQVEAQPAHSDKFWKDA